MVFPAAQRPASARPAERPFAIAPVFEVVLPITAFNPGIGVIAIS